MKCSKVFVFLSVFVAFSFGLANVGVAKNEDVFTSSDPAMKEKRFFGLGVAASWAAKKLVVTALSSYCSWKNNGLSSTGKDVCSCVAGVGGLIGDEEMERAMNSMGVKRWFWSGSLWDKLKSAVKEGCNYKYTKYLSTLKDACNCIQRFI